MKNNSNNELGDIDLVELKHLMSEFGQLSLVAMNPSISDTVRLNAYKRFAEIQAILMQKQNQMLLLGLTSINEDDYVEAKNFDELTKKLFNKSDVVLDEMNASTQRQEKQMFAELDKINKLKEIDIKNKKREQYMNWGATIIALVIAIAGLVI